MLYRYVGGIKFMKLESNDKLKKDLYIVGSIVLYIFIVVALIIVAFVWGTKNHLDDRTFIKYSSDRGCKVINKMNEATDSAIKTYYKTDKNSCPYEISYLVVDNEVALDNVYDKFNLELYKGNNRITSFSKDRLNQNERHTEGSDYRVLIKNGNTIFYLRTDNEHKSDVFKLLEDYGFRGNMKLIIQKVSSLNGIKNLALIIFAIVSWWKLNQKMDRKGWVCLIPVYNILCLFEDIFGNKLYALLLLVPIINIITFFLLFYRIGEAFNKPTRYKILMLFIPYILIPILAFDDSKYSKPIA